MTPNTLFIPRSCKEWGLPKKADMYIVMYNDRMCTGRSFFSLEHGKFECENVDVWLEQIELPSDEEIEDYHYVDEDRMSDGDQERFLKQEGAKWLKQLIFKK